MVRNMNKRILSILLLSMTALVCAQTAPMLGSPAPQEHRGFYNSVSFGAAYNWYENSKKDMDDYNKAKEAYAILAAKSVELGGSPSAEHGIGKLKRDYIRMMYGDQGIEDIRRLKSYFDPNMILNRGDMIE